MQLAGLRRVGDEPFFVDERTLPVLGEGEMLVENPPVDEHRWGAVRKLELVGVGPLPVHNWGGQRDSVAEFDRRTFQFHCCNGQTYNSKKHKINVSTFLIQVKLTYIFHDNCYTIASKIHDTTP